MAIPEFDLSPYEANGVEVHWNQFSENIAMGWDEFNREPGCLSFNQAKHAVEAVVTNRDFIQATTAKMNVRVNPRDPFFLYVTAFQQGSRCGVFNVMNADLETDPYQFVLMMSRGNLNLNAQTAVDFDNLDDLHKRMVAAGLTPFVPQVYQKTEAAGVVGFSVQELPDHVELNVEGHHFELDEATTTDEPYPNFFMHTGTEGYIFNERNDARIEEVFSVLEAIPQTVDLTLRQGLARQLIRGSWWYHSTHQIQTALAQRLYLVNHLTEQFPKDFLVNAGDFMANPRVSDYDPHLITIRGGWEALNPKDIVAYLISLKDTDIYKDDKGNIYRTVHYPVLTPESVTQGAAEAKQLLGL